MRDIIGALAGKQGGAGCAAAAVLFTLACSPLADSNSQAQAQAQARAQSEHPAPEAEVLADGATPAFHSLHFTPREIP